MGFLVKKKTRVCSGEINRIEIEIKHSIHIPLELELERVLLHQRGLLTWMKEDKMALAAICTVITKFSFRLETRIYQS